MFDEFQTAHIPAERRPKIENLYDVYVAIRDDEGEHVKTMVACQRSDAQLTFKSPHSPDSKPLSEGAMQAIAITADKMLETEAEPVK